MPLQPGTKVGFYEIVAPLATAVTESYRGADVRTNRPVTVKPFPLLMAQNSELRQRLEREIQLVATLKHPHICALLEVLHEGDDEYLITEFLEGETLAERLKRSPMEVEEALGIAVTIAGALDKAHRQGVTHRGLNPSTIILAASGAKIVDFGFAAHQGAAEPPIAASQLSTRTVSSPAASIPSYAAPYMAPEQFDGKDADARTDIFAFGAVLYEMLAGRPAFEGKTPAMLLAAVQTVDPEPLSKLQPGTPPALEFVVKRCLAKDPSQRLQTARDLLNQLQWISEGGSGIVVQPITAAGSQKQNRLLWIAAAALGLVTVMFIPSSYRYFRGTPESPAVRFGVSLPGTAVGTGGTPIAVSPDGRWILNARAGGNNGGVYLLQLGSVTPKFLFEGTPIFSPFWSPDSRSFGYFDTTNGKLKVSDVSGSPPRTISDAPAPTGGGTWSQDGVILFASGGVLQRVPAAGGQPTPITALDTALQETEHVGPNFLPDGRHYLYLAISAQSAESAIYVGALDSKERIRLFASETPAIYAAPGYVLFNRATAVFAQPFDAKALKLTGEPIRLDDAALRGAAAAGQLSPNLTKAALISVSQTGVLAYRKATPGAGTASTPGGLALTWFDRSAQGTQQVSGVGSYAGIDLAPDGKRFAVHQHEGEGGDSWFFDSGRMQRLTFNTAQDNSMPVWSRDGKKIAFGSKRNGKWGLYIKAADGTGPEELIFESELIKAPMSWSSDDKVLVFCAVDPKTRGDIWMVPVQGDHKPVALLQTNADEALAQVSPDGKWMVYQSDETGTLQIYVRPFPEGSGNKSQISADGPALWPRWSGDGKHLFFVVAPSVVETEIKVMGSSVQPGVPRVLFPLFSNPNNPQHAAPHHRYAVTPDGQRFLFPQTPGSSSVSGGLSGGLTAIVDQSAPGVPTSNGDSVNIVLNWTRSLQRK